MHGSTLTVRLYSSRDPPIRNALVETPLHHDDTIYHHHACTVDKPAAVDIYIRVARFEAYDQYHESDMTRRFPERPPATYFPSYYAEGMYWRRVLGGPVLDNEHECYYTFMHPFPNDGRIACPRLNDCDRGPDGTGRSIYAVLPYFDVPLPPAWHLEVIVTALPPTYPAHVLARRNLLLHDDSGLEISSLVLHGTPLEGLRLTFYRVDISGKGSALPVNPNEQTFACFDFHMRDTLQEVEIDEEASGEEHGEDEEEEAEDEDAGDEESAVEEEGEGEEEEESSSDSTPSVAETWHVR